MNAATAGLHLGAPFTMTDALHIAFAMVTVAFFIAEIVLGALALGRAFRIYSALTVLVFLVFGILTAIDGPRIAQNLPTPWIGVWERINIGAFMLWIAVLSVALLRQQDQGQK